MLPLRADLIRKINRLPEDIREVILTLVENLEDFGEIKEIVRKLTEAQSKSEERLSRLEKAVEELIKAQIKTEERLSKIEKVLEELIKAHRESEKRLAKVEERLSRVEKAIEELINAQKQTEKRLNELAEAQKQTEKRLNELAEAQERTEKEIEKLTRGLRNLREEVSGLARSFSYALENEAYRRLPAFLKERYGIEVLDRIIRFDLDGEEINLFAKANRNGQEILLVGESVAKFTHAREIKSLERKAEKIKRVYGKEVIGIIVTHFAKTKLKEKAQEAGFIVIQSFEW